MNPALTALLQLTPAAIENLDFIKTIQYIGYGKLLTP